MGRDYIPQNPAQFNTFMDNLTKYVAKNKTKWALIPLEQFQELLDGFMAFQTIFLPLVGQPINKAQRERIHEAQAACISLARPFVNQWLRFPPITNADRIEMGIPNHDTIRTDHKVVTEMVDFVLHLRNIREIIVDFWEQGSSNKAKPKGYDGAVVIWGLADVAPQHPDELNHHAMASRTPFALHFEESERGKTVYVALAWQNERGITGHWSDYKTAVIP